MADKKNKHTLTPTPLPSPARLLCGEIVSLMLQRVDSLCTACTVRCMIPLLGPSSHLLPSRVSPHVNSSHVYTKKKVTA